MTGYDAQKDQHLKRLRRIEGQIRGLQRLGRRRHLSEDVDALCILLDHPLQSPDLPLDAAQPLEVGVPVLRVPGHRDPSGVT